MSEQTPPTQQLDTGQEAARAGGRVALGAAGAFLIAVPFTLLVMLITAQSESVERLDRRVADALHGLVIGDATATTVLEVIDRVTNPWVLRTVALLIALALLARGRRRTALWLVLTVALGGLVGLGLKELVQRARPAFDEPVYVAAGYSFPSGHALNSMLIVVAVVVALWPVLSRGGRVLAVVTGTVLVVVVGLDRVALGVHFLTDVLAGWLVGLAVVAGTGAAFLNADDGRWQRREPRPGVRLTWPRALSRMLGRLLAGWLAILTVMVGLGLLITRVVEDRWPLTEEDRINSALEEGRTPVGDSATLLMRHIGDTPVIIGTMLVVVVILRMVLGRWREGLFVVAATAGQAIVFTLTAALVDRPRPDVEKLDSSPPTSSFPSGHTSAGLALYLSIAVVAVRRVRRPWLRYLLVCLCLVPPILVAYARLYRGMHHPSDIAGSVVNATLCLWLAARVVLEGPLPEDEQQVTLRQAVVPAARDDDHGGGPPAAAHASGTAGHGTHTTGTAGPGNAGPSHSDDKAGAPP